MSETTYFVYRLTFANGKVYVGMSKTCPKKGYLRRFYEHEKNASSGKQLPVYAAWRKHGEPSFEVLSMHADRASCAEAEIAAIAEHGSISEGKGYNIMGGGEGQQAGQNPRLWAILSEKVWHNPDVRKKISNKLKGRSPSKATADGYREFCKTPGKAEAARRAWRNPEYRAMRSAMTKAQMANGGSALLSSAFKGRPCTLTEEQREAQRERMTKWVNSEEGKAACRRGYETMASNPEAVEKCLAGMRAWRESERNAEHCKAIAKLAAKACSKRIRNIETGEVFDSQREMAKAYGIAEQTVIKRRKRGICESC